MIPQMTAELDAILPDFTVQWFRQIGYARSSNAQFRREYDNVGSDEMHRRRKRYAAFVNTLDLHRLCHRMVYLEDRQGVGKSGRRNTKLSSRHR